MIDFRETAPRKIRLSDYSKSPELAKKGGLAVCIPGELKGFMKMHKKYGKLNWEELFKENIDLCFNGFKAHKNLLEKLIKNEKDIFKDEGLKETFVKDNKLVKIGDVIKRENLGKTLKIISKDPESFYSGEIAEELAIFINKNGGKVDLTDFKDYQAVEREVIKTIFNEYNVYTTNTPSSGVFISYALNVIKNIDESKLNIIKSKKSLCYFYHLMIEIFKFMFSRRGKLGDPDFQADWRLAVSEILSDKLAKETANSIKYDCVLGKESHKVLPFKEDHGTSHLNVIDEEGNVVSLTTSVNLEFGSMILNKKYGVLLNNTIDDFMHPDFINAYELDNTSTSNNLGPLKRPFSSMSPTIFVKKNKNREEIISIGAAGGTRIPTSILLTLFYHLFLKMPLENAISFNRVHDQLLPPKTFVEFNFPKQLADELRQLGHNVEFSDENTTFTSVQAITAIFDKDQGNKIIAASDKRKNGVSCGV
ncbi:GGT1 [Hepatospora eriocheir]|uniref:GGT1 n=1 Tax=Hepatospora eriocheir TaxID=1081669 RepID=A0A1X0QJK3_9MICR|nr:GGT1 [Hepatospora eriocheir]